MIYIDKNKRTPNKGLKQILRDSIFILFLSVLSFLNVIVLILDYIVIKSFF